MKQNITPKQLNELSEKGRNRLRKWYLKTYLIDMTDMRQLALATKEELTAHYNRRIEDVLCLSIGQMIEFLEEHKISIEPLDIHSATAAAQAWMRYLKRKTKVKCPQCGRKLELKDHFLSDFYIGGFASAKCSAILTRDRGIYTKYFPALEGYEDCLKPSSH